ncbi:PAS domain-containing protein [Halogeometricum luteum]|uniref:PAS domain-containing protein n=1 Tax=Halogeometricum luteum TaxID=2950537 RepID=A0ABU2FZN8_9EURY|nr:PAS domain-containing protein [Halogeometricum sp. S3BR5-2]MDS0293454.1 PAS domain-containing protein [Halogeometricum sp. S3BR5-2]
MHTGPPGGEDTSAERVISEPAEILERVSDAFYALDAEWRFRYVNERATELLDRSEDELLGRSVWEAFPEATETALWTEYHEAMETQDPTSFELYYESLGGWFEVNAHPSETGLSVYFRDVTAEKERERRLAETRRRYRTLVDNFPNGSVALFDHDLRLLVTGGDAEKLDGVRPERLSAFERDELAGERLSDIVQPEAFEEIEPHYRATLDGETRTFLLPIGDRMHRVRTAPVRGDDDVLAGLAISQDVTGRFEKQRELEARSHQQEVVAELGRLALEHPPLDDLFDRATEAVAETLDNDYCKVLDLTDDGRELFLRSGVGWKLGHVGEASVANDESTQAGYTLLSADPVVVDDLSAETRFSGPDLLVDHGVVSGISTIIGPVDDPWGILGTHDTEERSFTEYDVDFVQSVANILATAIDHRDSERERRAQREQLAALNDLNSLVQQISESAVRQSSREEIERLLCETLAASDSYVFAWIGEADESTGEIRCRCESGVENYLSNIALSLDGPGRDGPTAQALLTGETQVVQDVDESANYASWRDHARTYGYRSSAAIPIAFGDDRYGVLNVYSERPGAFGAEERTALSRLGTIVGHALRSVERDRQLRESEKRYRTLAENVPNGAVALVDTDLTYLLAAGSNFDRVDVDPSDIEGRHVEDISFAPVAVRDRVNDALRTALAGETTTIRVEFEGRTIEYRTVPVYDDDGEVRAAMSLSQDITERVRREEELEHERERLELMNRLIRHNLLNSLNVVDARLEFVEEKVDDSVAEHLATARKRTDSMIELVQTIRSLMNAIVESDEVALEPISLDEAIRSTITATRELFPEAELVYEGPSDVAVCANELLDEVIENLLVNAVQHNDKPTPRVTADAEVGEETVTLVVADNGPGVDPDLESRIFEKGAKGFESPGTGFGLHLVREIVEAYGGDVSVTNRPEGGAAFRVVLPRASEDPEDADAESDADTESESDADAESESGSESESASGAGS